MAEKKPRGRPKGSGTPVKVTQEHRDILRAMMLTTGRDGLNIALASRTTGLSRQTIYRLLGEWERERQEPT